MHLITCYKIHFRGKDAAFKYSADLVLKDDLVEV
jgi:hypothetical protein